MPRSTRTLKVTAVTIVVLFACLCTVFIFGPFVIHTVNQIIAQPVEGELRKSYEEYLAMTKQEGDITTFDAIAYDDQTACAIAHFQYPEQFYRSVPTPGEPPPQTYTSYRTDYDVVVFAMQNNHWEVTSVNPNGCSRCSDGGVDPNPYIRCPMEIVKPPWWPG